MKKLGERNYFLMLDAIKTTGSFDPKEIFFYFEENLHIEESIIIRNFLTWVHENNRGFGHCNFESVFQEFLNKE
tara:strand:- start:4002 stop:4223 length:222 start_codon:yes stop_codon:yes gene_type:complete